MIKILRPCPRCGVTKFDEDTLDFSDSNTTYYRVMCINGHAWDDWSDTMEEAMDVWNEGWNGDN